MKLITLDEAKEKLSIDFADKGGEIENLVAAAESYLYFATGLDFSTLADSLEETEQQAYSAARGWLFLRIYLDYYSQHTDLNDAQLTSYMKQLQYYAATVS